MQPGAFMEPQHMNLLQGLSAFPITPADEHGIVDTDALGGLVHRLGQEEVNSICVLGSTGTYAYLSRQERQRAIRSDRKSTRMNYSHECATRMPSYACNNIN